MNVANRPAAIGLPVWKHPGAREIHPPLGTLRRRPRSIRVLLVEDNPGDARLVREMLREEGNFSFHLKHVFRLSEALEQLAGSEFEAVLLDLELPDAHGLEAIPPVNLAAPDVPIVVLSGTEDERLAVQAVQQGAQDYLVKGRGDATLIARSIRYAMERKNSEQYINYLAHHDGLTALPNRRLLVDRLEQALSRARRNRLMVAVLFLDIDHFKNINDTLGHTAGDDLLKELADRLRRCVRESDTIARIGGDEFALILQDIARPADAETLARKVAAATRPPFRVLGKELFITSSMGISFYPSDGEDPDGLLKTADVAMYRSKHQGRDTYSFYSPSSTAYRSERLTLATSLRYALEREEFLLHYQPLVDLRSGRITGFEALIRWVHPDLSLLLPASFIGLAEDCGLICPIGEWVLRTACRQARAWRDAGHPSLGVSVNVSSHQFKQAGLARAVRDALEATGLQPAQLELELTESGIMHNPHAAILTLRELRETGVRVSVDDFGTGYSSLSHLKRFPLDGLKIDRSFVCDADNNRTDAAIVRAIISMAHGLGMQVTAEGVETEGQLGLLRQEACDRGQGYYFSRPLPVDSLEELVGTSGRWN